jgi:hypothetical protein
MSVFWMQTWQRLIWFSRILYYCNYRVNYYCVVDDSHIKAFTEGVCLVIIVAMLLSLLCELYNKYHTASLNCWCFIVLH